MVQHLPHLNASLNLTAAVLLFWGWWAIKKQNKEKLHAKLMSFAFLVSTAFLISYLSFHFFGEAKKLQTTSVWRFAYFAMLISHIALAPIVVVMVLRTFYLAIKKRLPEHVKFGKLTLALWFYVSVTGVLIYLVLYQFGW